MKSLPSCLGLLASVLAGMAATTDLPHARTSSFDHLHSDTPFHVGRHFPKLTTPQWIGEKGVEAAVILSIDDMRDAGKYEAYLRPILNRLKQIDGRAPLSILVNSVSPTNAQVRTWLREGLSLECHTISHPCPLCQKGDFSAAAANYHECVDLLAAIPGQHPVAFRMPCCDSMNSPTPRFYAEIFNHTSAQGRFLGIDSSVMVMLTTNDSSLPRELVLEADGRERFRKYLPAQSNAQTKVSMGSFTTTIEDYPYPYVFGKLAWEFPAIIPSDWEAQNVHGVNNAKTVEDWERALDAIVLKQGVMTFIFHPHGWIQAEQLVQFIDYAVSRYGQRVKFLSFKEAQDRLNTHLLAGQPLRSPTGGENGVRLADLNQDGFMDVLIGREAGPTNVTRMRLWDAAAGRWKESPLPFALAKPSSPGSFTETGVQFGTIERRTVAFSPASREGWALTEGNWRSLNTLTNGLDFSSLVPPTGRPEFGWRFHDLNRDGQDELLVSRPGVNHAFEWNQAQSRWQPLPYALPEGTSLVDDQGREAGLRFVDVDGDGYDDVIFSNQERYSLHLFRKDARELRLRPGWTDEILSGTRSNALTDPIPPIVRAGTNRNNGVWFKDGWMWIQNEDTAHLPDKVDRRSFRQWLQGSQPSALSPEASLRAIRVPPGFVVEQVASEPLIHSPVAFDWTADGRLWVVEMGDYPSGTDSRGQAGGRVRILEDLNGDGRYDRATTFLDGLNFPTGIHPWREGVIISAAPEVFYAADTNGDGRADLRVPLFTGFVEGNQQHRVNGFDYGLDGWLYGANGDSGGNIQALGAGAAKSRVNLRGQDFRLHPDRLLFEAIEGQTQFGRHRDDFGNWFGNNNPNWLWHYAFPAHYLIRNPLLPLKSTRRQLANDPDGTRCFPASRLLSRFNDAHAANHVTSGNSPTPYRDDLFGPEYATSVFISEPVHNLIHREVLEADGVSFRSHRATKEQATEFLASSDNWFRPVMLKTGPDGALYLADMYRLVIEHPEWIPAEMQKRLDLRAGADLGRIYRVFPKQAQPRRIPDLSRLSPNELVAALDSPNGWQRDTAQRLLIEQKVQTVTPALEALAQQAPGEKVRVQALWTLHGLDQLQPELLLTALRDEAAAVREHAVRLSEGFAQRSFAPEIYQIKRGDTLGRIAQQFGTTPGEIQRLNQLDPTKLRVGQMVRIPDTGSRILARLISLRSDASPRVRYQIAFTLGEWNAPKAAESLLELLGDAEEGVRNAALSSAARPASRLVALVKALPPEDARRAHLTMFQKLAANPPRAAMSESFTENARKVSPEHLEERQKVVARYAQTGLLTGRGTEGAGLFAQHCAPCHRLGQIGHEVGPDLAMMAGKPTEQLIEAILNPNAAMEARYQNVTVLLRDDREASGLVVSETPTTLTLRAPNRPDEVLLRAEVKTLTTSGLSLMPDGFENAFTPQQLADLIAYVTGKSR